jgi:hypothetical protein
MTNYEYAIKRGKGRGLRTVGAKPRIFQMIRHVDGKSISGVGKVIDGVVFSDGTVVIQWQGEKKSLGIYKDLNHFLAIHVKPKYEGENEFRWMEGYKPSEDVAEVCDTVKDYILRFQDLKEKHKGALIAVLQGIKRKYEEITLEEAPDER